MPILDFFINSAVSVVAFVGASEAAREKNRSTLFVMVIAGVAALLSNAVKLVRWFELWR